MNLERGRGSFLRGSGRPKFKGYRQIVRPVAMTRLSSDGRSGGITRRDAPVITLTLPDNIRAKVNGASKRSPSISPRSLPGDKSQYSRFGVRLHKVPNRRQIPPVLPVLGLD